MQTNKTDFFTKNHTKEGFGSGVIRRPEKKRNTGWIVVLIVLIAIFIVIYLFSEKKIFIQQDNPHIQKQLKYNIGNEIQKKGILEAKGDIIAYTHTLTTDEDEKLFLKSKTQPLDNYTNNYSGTFQIMGTVESFFGNTPIVEVTSLEKIEIKGENNQEEGVITTKETINPGTYINSLGIHFLPDFFDNYSFVDDPGKNMEINIKNLDNDKITKISAFNCSDHGDTNCKELTRTFNDTAEKKITTSNGDTFYKLPEVKSRYFQNELRRGYFINEGEDSEIEKIKDYIILPNKNLIKQLVSLYGVKVCFGKENINNQVENYTVEKTAEGLKVNINGKGETDFNCEATIDLAQTLKMKFIDIKTNKKEPSNDEKENEEKKSKNEKSKDITEKSETNKEDEKEKKKDTTSISFNSGIEQFPISEEKQLTYTSKRNNVVMKFPSMNISYATDNTNNDFDQIGVKCNYETKIISYKKADLIDSEPTIIIYECSVKKEFTPPGENFLVEEVDGKHFIIKVMDSEWFNFAKNIQITAIKE